MHKVLMTLGLLILATTLEAGGDAVVRIGLKAQALPIRALIMLGGAALLYLYALTFNLAPLDWGRLIGAYVATFFVVGQIINLVVFKTAPSVPILVGGAFFVAGGLIVTLWER